jgi:hypothetical protein
VDATRAGQEEPVAPLPAAAVGIGTGLSVAALALAGAIGPPYLDLSSLNPFIGAFAVTAFAALFAVPFAANRRLVQSNPERAESWERAMVAWGAVALTLLLLAALVAIPGGFSPADSLVDAAAAILLAESGLVLLVLGAWVLSS